MPPVFMEEKYRTMEKYVLVTRNNKTEFDTKEDALDAYKNCTEEFKFLYEPDKNYYVGTVSSTGMIVGHDHAYHRDTAKCRGLFRADTKKQINEFLKKRHWHHDGADHSTGARLYGNGPYGSLYNSRDNWNDFVSEVQRFYLNSGNINYFNYLNDAYGALDVEKYSGSNPYRLY